MRLAMDCIRQRRVNFEDGHILQLGEEVRGTREVRGLIGVLTSGARQISLT